MACIIYKFTILCGAKYCDNKPFYIGQFMRNISREDFLRKDRCVYDGSGKIWLKFCAGLKRKFPNCWRRLIKREVLFYSDNCSQKCLDKLEEYYIKKHKAHYSYKLGGCNVLWGTANKFGSGSPMKDPAIAAKVTAKLRGRVGAKRTEEVKKMMSESAKKSWKNNNKRRELVSKAVSFYMQHGGRQYLSKIEKGKIVSDETKKKISLNHADFRKDKHPLWGSTFIWITNGIKNKRHVPGKEIPEGWIKGKTQKGKIYKH